MNIANCLVKSTLNNPNAIAIYEGKTPYATYAELLVDAKRLATGLQQQGMQKGDKVAVFSENCPEYLAFFYAVWWIGGVIVPINYKLHPAEATWIIEHSQAKWLFSQTTLDNLPSACRNVVINSEDYQALLRVSAEPRLAHPIALSGDDVAWLFYTSGTTGRPKGAMLTHQNLITMILNYGTDVDSANPRYQQLYAAPMSHGAGLYHLVFINSGAAHIIPKSRQFNEKEIQMLAEHFGHIVMFAAPTMVRRLVQWATDHDWHGEGIQTIIYGGGPMYVTDINAALAQFGDKFVQIYGQGETPMTISSLKREQLSAEHPDTEKRKTSVGQVMTGIRVSIVDEHFAELPPYQTGEIVVKGDSVMKGYFNNTAATEETLVNQWLRTGDLGYFDDAGFLYLTDRMKDVIISGGSNIYPREVEEVLLCHPAIDAVSVVGQKDSEWGEIVVAFVVLQTGATVDATALDTWCKQQIASFKKPKRYHFIKELPKNSYGKVLKTQLREQL